MLAREELDAEHSSHAQAGAPRRADHLIASIDLEVVRHGPNIPPMTMYMDGFWEGMRQYNK